MFAHNPGLYDTDFGFIKNRLNCTGKTEITGCTFLNFTRSAVNTNSYNNKDFKTLINACTFTYEGTSSISDKKIYTLNKPILFSHTGDVRLSDCKFEITEGSYAYIDSGFQDGIYSIYPCIPFVKIVNAKKFICTRNNFQKIHCNYNLYSSTYNSSSQTEITNCKFNAFVNIDDLYHSSNITIEKCSFDRWNPVLKCASLYIAAYESKTIQNTSRVRVKDCTFNLTDSNEVIFLQPRRTGDPFTRNTVTYYPSRIDIINCELAHDKVRLFNIQREIIGYDSSNKPIYAVQGFGPAMVMFKYSTPVDKEAVKSYVQMDTYSNPSDPINCENFGAVFLNLPDGEMPSNTSSYKIKGTVNSP